MQQFTIILKDESKREFLLELLTRLEFVEFKLAPNMKAFKSSKSSKAKVSKTGTPVQAITLKRGSAKGLIGHVPDDFNAPLEDFKEYM